jgi:hypothetical protein
MTIQMLNAGLGPLKVARDHLREVPLWALMEQAMLHRVDLWLHREMLRLNIKSSKRRKPKN